MTLKEALNTRKRTFNFPNYSGSSREDYLAWVKEWKKEYNELSQEIRFLKQRRKASLYGDDVSRIATNRCIVFKYTAYDALEARKAAKLLAKEQREKMKLEMAS